MTPHRFARALAAPAALLLCLALAAPEPAAAAGREFNGVIVQVGDRRLVVESRRGETLRFRRTKATALEGKARWKDLAAGDRVIVEWDLGEGPRRATRVIVLSGGG